MCVVLGHREAWQGRRAEMHAHMVELGLPKTMGVPVQIYSFLGNVSWVSISTVAGRCTEMHQHMVELGLCKPFVSGGLEQL